VAASTLKQSITLAIQDISATMSNASLLLVPAGYLFANVNSTVVKIPYYAI